MPTDTGPLRNLVTIENSTIDSLAGNESFKQAFPYLAALVKPKLVKPGCRRCMKKQRATLAEYREFKNSLAAMQPADKIRFKQFLDCKNVRVVHVNAANKVIDRTF